MKADKKPIIGFICFMLSCILVIGVAIGLLGSVNKAAPADTTDNTTSTPEETPAEEPELEWGYKFHYGDGRGSGCLSNWPCRIAYKSDKKTFDIDNVKLTLSFGIQLVEEIDFEEFIEYAPEGMGWDVPEFEIYFSDTNKHINKLYTAREVKESFITEKYRVVYMEDKDNNSCYFLFNHSEEITIPKELFTESEGVITICVGGINVAGNNPSYEIYTDTDIKYELTVDNKVVLSPRWEYSPDNSTVDDGVEDTSVSSGYIIPLGGGCDPQEFIPYDCAYRFETNEYEVNAVTGKVSYSIDKYAFEVNYNDNHNFWFFYQDSVTDYNIYFVIENTEAAHDLRSSRYNHEPAYAQHLKGTDVGSVQNGIYVHERFEITDLNAFPFYEYSMSSYRNEKEQIIREFAHTEEITIPEQLFYGDKGCVEMSLIECVSYESGRVSYSRACQYFYYLKEGNQVKLSKAQFK